MSQHWLLMSAERNTKYIDEKRERERKKKGIMQITCVATATDSNRGHFMSLTSWDTDERVYASLSDSPLLHPC